MFTVNYMIEDIFERDWPSEQYDNVVAVFIQFVPPAQIIKVLTGLATSSQTQRNFTCSWLHAQQVEFGTGGPPNPEHMYTEAMLRDIYQHLDIQVCEEYIDTLNEGRGHSGKSALIDLVGIKTA